MNIIEEFQNLNPETKLFSHMFNVSYKELIIELISIERNRRQSAKIIDICHNSAKYFKNNHNINTKQEYINFCNDISFYNRDTLDNVANKLFNNA
jgi:hypothetical protein